MFDVAKSQREDLIARIMEKDFPGKGRKYTRDEAEAKIDAFAAKQAAERAAEKAAEAEPDNAPPPRSPARFREPVVTAAPVKGGIQRLMSVHDVAKRLSVSKMTVGRWIHERAGEGKPLAFPLPGYIVGGDFWAWNPDAVTSWLNAIKDGLATRISTDAEAVKRWRKMLSGDKRKGAAARRAKVRADRRT